MIPCSDAFGVDLLVEKYADVLAKRDAEKKNNHPSQIDEDKIKLINVLGEAI